MRDLREAWAELLARRSPLAASLSIYTRVLDAWAEVPAAIVPLEWSATESRRTWAEGMPIDAAAPPAIDPAAIEDLLGVAMEVVAEARDDARPGLGRLAEAWDRGEVTPRSLLPTPGRISGLDMTPAIDDDASAFLSVVALRPSLEAYHDTIRPYLRDADWDRGRCPCCGAAPGFAEVTEQGHRRLACHVCGGAWTFTRLRCPFCGEAETRNLGRLDFEAAPDQGYFVSTCSSCRGYIKELDRRVRWNGGPPVLEDWASPHVDLACERAGYRRPGWPVILARPVSGT